MNTEHIISNINQFVQLDQTEIDYLISVLIARPFRQGETIVVSGEPARYLIFTNAGYLMTSYTHSEDVEHVIPFSAEGWWSGDTYSLSSSPTTPFTTKGLRDGEALLLPRLAHDYMLDHFPKFER